MQKITIIEAGLDWNDAEYTTFILLTDKSIEELRKMCPEGEWFPTWIIDNGYARLTTDKEVEIFKS